MIVLDIQNLKKRYDDFILDIDLKLHEGEFTALIGPNGSGKSTTISSVLNMVRRDSGDILIFGKDNIRCEAEIKENMGIILDEQHFYRDVKVDSIIKFYSRFYKRWDKERVKELREKFDLKENKKFKELSKGMKVKLSFIIALSTGASFYLFDEPFSGLDPAIRAVLLKEIERLKERDGITVLFTSHIMSDVESFAERIVFINKGRIVFDEKLCVLKNTRKRITFCSEKEFDFREIEHKVFKINRDESKYTLITESDPDSVVKYLQTEGFLDTKSEDLTLNELFVEIVNSDTAG